MIPLRTWRRAGPRSSPLRRAARSLAGGILAALPAAAIMAQEASLRAPLSAQVRFTDADGAPQSRILPGQPFDVVLEIRSELGAVPTDLLPMGWIRERGPFDLPCGETAAAYRASGRAAIGSVDLNGTVLGVVARDGAFTVLDPERALGAANLLTARHFQPPPAALAADPATGQFLLSLPGGEAGLGQVLAISPYGTQQVLASDLDDPATLVPAITGGAWLLEQGSGDVLRLDPAGPARHLALGATQIRGDGDTEPAQRLAVLSPDRLRVLEDDGRISLDAPAPGALAVGLNADAALWLAPGMLHVLWLDAPDQPLAIPLAGAFDRMEISPEGRMAYVFAHGRTGFGIVDLALGRMVQGADTESPVAEIAFLPDTALLRLADQSSVGVMDLREIAPDTEAVVGRVAIGPPRPMAEAEGAALLAPLLPEPSLLAVHAGSYSGFVLDGRHAVSGMPPMEALRLRGGVPQLVRALDRSLRQTAPGHFTAAAELPRAGDWELVVSVGIGQLAFCAPVPSPPAPQDTALPGQISPQPDKAGRTRLRFLAADGTPAGELNGVLELATLTGNWRATQPFATDAAGLTTDSYDLRAYLPLVVTTRGTAQGRDRAGFAPLILENTP